MNELYDVEFVMYTVVIRFELPLVFTMMAEQLLYDFLTYETDFMFTINYMLHNKHEEFQNYEVKYNMQKPKVIKIE